MEKRYKSINLFEFQQQFPDAHRVMIMRPILNAPMGSNARNANILISVKGS